jgi:hypothetical protein
MSVHLWLQITPWYLKRTVRQRHSKKFDMLMKARLLQGKAPSGLPKDFKIKTVERSLRRITIEYWGETQSFNAGNGPDRFSGVTHRRLGSGAIPSVPIMVTFFGLPCTCWLRHDPLRHHVVLTGLISYTVTILC